MQRKLRQQQQQPLQNKVYDLKNKKKKEISQRVFFRLFHEKSYQVVVKIK